MRGGAGIVDGAPEYVQNTTINALPAERTELLIHLLRICTTKLRNRTIPEIGQLLRNTRADPGNVLKSGVRFGTPRFRHLSQPGNKVKVILSCALHQFKTIESLPFSIERAPFLYPGLSLAVFAGPGDD